MTKNKNSNEKKILKYLEKEGRSSTSEVSTNAGINYYTTKKLLLKLRREKKVESEKEARGLYWIIK